VLHDDVAAAEHLLRAGALVLVDGYNVAMLGWPDRPLADQRERLLDALEDLVRRVGTRLLVVFDGADVTGVFHGRRLLRVRFSPAGVSADDAIRGEVAAHPPAEPVVVVTNDLAIRGDVARSGVNLLRSEQLLAVAVR
jgi:predicted RNA-binding protein with PIN domain